MDHKIVLNQAIKRLDEAIKRIEQLGSKYYIKKYGDQPIKPKQLTKIRFKGKTKKRIIYIKTKKENEFLK